MATTWLETGMVQRKWYKYSRTCDELQAAKDQGQEKVAELVSKADKQYNAYHALAQSYLDFAMPFPKRH